MDYKNDDRVSGIEHFYSIYSSLISIFIGFSLPFIFELRVKLVSPLEVMSYAFLAIGILLFFKKITLRQTDKMNMGLSHISKNQFKKNHFYYIYFFTEFVFYPFLLGFYLANIFFA